MSNYILDRRAASCGGRDYSKEYMTFECIASGDLSVTSNSTYDRSFDVSLNDNAWETISVTSKVTNLFVKSLTVGDKLRLRRNGNNLADLSFRGDSTLRFNVYGNILSMQYGDNFIGQTTILDSRQTCFKALFSYCNNVVHSNNLILSPLTLTVDCYRSMFDSAVNLVDGPVILATAPISKCFLEMFKNASSLQYPPVWPSLVFTSADSVCMSMFSGCTALQKCPDMLVANGNMANMFNSMFKSCTNITDASNIIFSATSFWLNARAMKSMFENCTNLTTAPDFSCINIITGDSVGEHFEAAFKNCTSLESILLPSVKTLPINCYKEAFYGCSSLTYIKCITTDISATDCTTNWVYGVPNNGTFVKNPSMSSWPSGDNGIPSGWTVVDAS